VVLFLSAAICSVFYIAHNYFIRSAPPTKALSIVGASVLSIVTVLHLSDQAKLQKEKTEIIEHKEVLFEPFQQIGDHTVYSRKVNSNTDFIVLPTPK
jgi:hypothetical protein